MQRYAVVQNNLIMGIILWDGVTPYTPPAGSTLVLESDAIAAGLSYYVPPDPTTKARAAIATNRSSATQDANIATQADTVANGTGTLTTAQLTSTVRQLAQAVAALARNDAQGCRQRNAVILQMLALYDDSDA